MTDITVIKGGLGNQMFDYCFFLSLKRKSRFRLHIIEIEPSVERHYGLELFKIFHTKGAWRVALYNFLYNHHCRWYIHRHQTIVQGNSLEYNPDYLLKRSGLYRYDGYWQSEKYFTDIKDTVRKHFRFRTDLLNERTKECASHLCETASVSIHIRRGDYLNESGWDKSETDFYQQAQSYILKQEEHPVFYVFSDDMEWCRTRFKGENYRLVDWNTGNDSWQDMYLMSQCKHNIIANSSFSWWGAWLNNNPQKIVIAPEQWFCFSPNYDIIPIGWVTI